MIIILGVSASVAVYKSCDVIRELTHRGHTVRVALTEKASQWIHPELFHALSAQPVYAPGWDYGSTMPHIAVRMDADLMAVVPASANLIARAAAGMADDPVTATLLSFTGPKLLAPSMNPGMLQNPATQRNLKMLSNDGFKVIEPQNGEAVCGETGYGKLATVEQIVSAIEAAGKA